MFVKLQRNDRLGQLVQIAAQDVGGIVDGIPGPVQAFSISFGGVEDLLEILDAFCRSVKTKDTFHIGCYSRRASVSRVSSSLDEGRETRKERTLFFQEDPTFSNHNGHVTVDETFTVIVGE